MKSLDVDIDSIIRKGVRDVIKEAKSKLPKEDDQIKESLVAQPKVYRQVSEFVSQHTKDAHSALYKSYIDAFNKASAEIDSVDRTTANSKHSAFRSLKLDESYNLNAVWLHELYFSNCFDPHSEVYMDSSAFMMLQREFGTFDDWQKDFIACAQACGDGWAVCGYSFFTNKIINTVISNNSQDVMLGFYPVIVLDMHEHAYFRDHLSDKDSYVIAQLRQLNWNVIEERFLRIKTLQEAMKAMVGGSDK